MHHSRKRCWMLVLLVITLPTSSGCVAIYWRKPVDVQVFDAETGNPVKDATAHVNYAHVIDFVMNRPESHHEITDAQGKATLKVANYGFPTYSVRAAGYLPELSPHFGKPLEYQEATDGQNAQVTFWLYRNPAPKISLVVPNGYRGPVLVERRPSGSRIQDRPGKRHFELHANIEGYIGFPASPLIERLKISNEDFRFLNGEKIEGYHGELGDDAIAMRSLDYFGTKYTIFVLGTKADQAKLETQIYRYEKNENGSKSRIGANDEAIERLFTEASNGQRVHATSNSASHQDP